MGFREWIVPQDRVFFDLIDRHVALAMECSVEFSHMLNDWSNVEAWRTRVKQLEHEADLVSHEVFERLNATFITPLDREDLARLTHAIDDIADALNAAATRITLYEIPGPTPIMREFIDILQAQLKELQAGVSVLRRSKGMSRQLPQHTVEIHRLENLADKVLNRAVSELFKSNDPLRIMKYKEVYDFLEGATDKCEDVADVLSDVVRKHG